MTLSTHVHVSNSMEIDRDCAVCVGSIVPHIILRPNNYAGSMWNCCILVLLWFTYIEAAQLEENALCKAFLSYPDYMGHTGAREMECIPSVPVHKASM